MALVLKDRVKETSTTAGTGTLTLAGAVTGFQSFAAVGSGNTTYYAIVDNVTGAWEVGVGTYTASGTTLSRTTVLSSSNSGALVTFTANSKDVFVTYPSSQGVWLDASGVDISTSFGAITTTSIATTTGTITTTPAANTDIANKAYVDSVAATGLTYHAAVYCATSVNISEATLAYNNGASGVGATLTRISSFAVLGVDGTTPPVGSRVMVRLQNTGAWNGIYTVTSVGSASTGWILTRATDADTYGPGVNQLSLNDYFYVQNGTTNKGISYVVSAPTGTIIFGTSSIQFSEFSSAQVYTAGTGLTLSSLEFSITNTGVSAATYGSASQVPVLAVNAQGQLTSVTNTSIAINGSAVSGNISGSAGSVANALTLGTYLTGGTYNGSAAVTATVDATSANTASKVVARDSSGNFSAGTITATLSGAATSATTATNLAGGAANQIAYQSGSGTTTFATAPSASNQVLNWNGSAFTWSAGTISGVPLGSNLNSLTAGTYLTGTAYNGSAAQTWTVNAASANTASTVVARDASGNFSASTITASLSGNATTATTATNQSGGTVNATTGAFSGVITSTVASGTVLNMAGQSDSFGYNATAGQGTYIKGTGTTYIYGGGVFYDGSALRTLLQSGNYNSYAPTLTGTGASGTWGINITGSAGSAGSASSVPWTGVSAGTRTNYDLGIQPPTSGFAGFYFSKSTSAAAAADAGYFLIRGTSDSFPVYTAEGITLVSDANSLNLFARGSSLVAGGNAWVRMGTGSSETFRLMSDYSYSLNSSRAPIFYDSDNTGYYVDPASTSNLASSITIGGRTVYTTAAIYDNSSSGNDIGIAFGSGIIYPTNGTGALINNSKALGNVSYTFSNLYLGSAAYAPIFYDYNNTAFYLDPASTSVLNDVNLVNGKWYTANNESGQSLNIYVRPNGDNTYVWRHIYGGTGSGYGTGVGGYGIYNQTLAGDYSVIYSPSGFATFPYSARSPIFYDSNNTAFYVDPASLSTLNRLLVYGGDSVSPTLQLQASVYPMLDMFSDNTNGNNRNWRLAGVYNSYGLFQILSSTAPNGTPSTARLGINGINGYVGIGAAATGPANWLQIGSVGSTGYSGNHIAIGDGTYVFAQYLNGGTSMDFYTNSAYFNFANQYTQMAGSSRAPIFYDSNNTAYYIDPASTSDAALRMRGGALFGPNTTWGAYLSIGTNGNASTSYASIAATDGNLHMDAKTGCDMYLNYYAGTSVRSYSSFYAPIFYDLDNSAYYVNPASTSNVNTINAVTLTGTINGMPYGGDSISGMGVATTWDYRPGVGYAAYAINYHTGVTLSGYPGYGGVRLYASSYPTLTSSTLRLEASTGVYTYGQFTNDSRVDAPIFYDYNNSAYYVDPASSSYLYSLQLSGATYFRPNNWIELNSTYGLYWPSSYGAHLQANDLSTYSPIAIRGNKNGWAGIYDYYSGVNMMFDSAGNGGFYREANGRWYQYYSLANNCTGFGTSTTASAYNIYCPTGIYSGGRVDGTIFYDSNNTGYYLDMNGSSNVSTTVTGNMYFMSNFNTASGSSAPLQAYSSGGSGAVMSFHRGGYYAVNFGLDSDNVMRLGGWSASANLLQIDMSGNLTMLANVTAYSDERLKKDWADLPEDFVERLARVKSGTYTRIDNEMRQIGVGAQSLRPLMEEAVFENADGTLSVAYGNAAMASSVELARYVTALEQRISQLEARI